MDMYIQGGGEIAVGGPPKKLRKIAEKLRKSRKNCIKIAVFSKGNCGWDLEKFRFPDSGQGKGAPKKKYKSEPG